jgi:phage tail protein X
VATEYTTLVAGERLDVIVFEHYGSAYGYTEAVLDDVRNRGLAALGLELPAGTTIYLPDVAAPERTQRTVNVWD